MSVPPPPVSMSSPTAPWSTFALLSPVSVSLLLEPMRFSIVVSVSLAASPPEIAPPITTLTAEDPA